MVNLTSDHTSVDAIYIATLSCIATGGKPEIYTYTWIHNGSVLTGETSPVLTGVDETKLGNYTCEVENLAGAIMDSILITQRLPGEEH